jgi:hypothetical protein
MAKPQSPARKDRGFAFPALKLSFLYDILRAENRDLYIKENIDETVFMFALFKCRKSDKGRN